jgi:resolvase-like protein
LGQDLAAQLEKVSGWDKVFKEKRFEAGRPALKACLEYLREGDTLAVSKLDRLARSTSDLYLACRESERLDWSQRVGSHQRSPKAKKKVGSDGFCTRATSRFWVQQKIAALIG